MSATQAFCPQGTVIAFASAGPGSPTDYNKTIGEVSSIEKSGQKMATDDATHLNSPNGYREFIATLKEGGEVTVNYNFIPGDAGQIALSATFEAGSTLPWKITLPDTLGAFTFLAIIEDFANYKFLSDKKASDSLKIKISGPVTFTAGSIISGS